MDKARIEFDDVQFRLSRMSEPVLRGMSLRRASRAR